MTLPRLRHTLASPADIGFHRNGWVYEVKYDGLRVFAYRDGSAVRLIGRSGNDLTRRFPRIVRAILGLPGDQHILDGELVIFDEEGVSKLNLVAQHGNEREAAFVMFDAPFLDGKDLRHKPLSARREMLEEKYNVGGGPCLKLAERLDTNGQNAFRIAQREGYEGIVAKDPNCFYTEDRSTRWIKIKAVEQDVFTVVGYTESSRRDGFSALMVADETGRYMGRVGTGFTASDLASLGARLADLVTLKPSVPPPSPVPSGAVWVRPELRVRVEYLPGKDHLRFPVFLGLERA